MAWLSPGLAYPSLKAFGWAAWLTTFQDHRRPHFTEMVERIEAARGG